MSIKRMSLIGLGAVLVGLITGLITRSIFMGILFPLLLLAFYLIWRNFGSIKQDTKIEDDSTPPVSVQKTPQEQPTSSSSSQEV